MRVADRHALICLPYAPMLNAQRPTPNAHIEMLCGRTLVASYLEGSIRDRTVGSRLETVQSSRVDALHTSALNTRMTTYNSGHGVSSFHHPENINPAVRTV